MKVSDYAAGLIVGVVAATVFYLSVKWHLGI